MRTESGIYRENEPVDRVSDKRRRKCVSTFYITRTQVREPASLSVVSIATKLADFISLLATFTEVVVGERVGEKEVVVAPDGLPWRQQQQHLYPRRSKYECRSERAFNSNGGGGDIEGYNT